MTDASYNDFLTLRVKFMIVIPSYLALLKKIYSFIKRKLLPSLLLLQKSRMGACPLCPVVFLFFFQ